MVFAPLFLCPHPTLAGLVSLGPLGFGYVFLAFLLLLLFPVTCLDHLGQFPGQQCTGNEERCERQYDSGEETVGVLGSPLYHILSPCPNINHTVQQRCSLIRPEKRYQEKKKVNSQSTVICTKKNRIAISSTQYRQAILRRKRKKTIKNKIQEDPSQKCLDCSDHCSLESFPFS